MSDDPFFKPNRPPRPPQPDERLFEFLSGFDRFRCELRDGSPHGVDAQFFLNENLLCRRRFDTRALAVQWAEGERKAMER
jgi:hypothetical protein